MTPTDPAAATSFGGWAADYHRWRPGYPEAAVDWLVQGPRAQVLEIGAGTGKLTDLLVERDLRVEVVEPDGRMLRLLEQHHPDLRTHHADVGAVPLPDASVDAVLVADAWHWFPKRNAVREVTRVLRPGGWLGCIWNVPQPQDAWEWTALDLDPARQLPADLGPLPRLGVDTGRAEQRSFPWTWPLGPEEWAGLVATFSHVQRKPERERDRVVEETQRLVAAAGAAAGTHRVALHQDAVCVRWYPADRDRPRSRCVERAE